ncbi:16S rRNA (uracil(1498)-N(3))-methyltransferase [Sporolactobacillus spathodeae]|uniref:Ribosomal RNA small subunit methyltransferase E n=1 Tax=Sporolactobacillus spathodeae TaxID=1465502 RepID=A0ABS2Q6D4_9BACL|nr:16S rRNA (uracil(1498)-N(3))-methyltransferase [Sporolactobacillus spathodeae]MBM7657349.1 16S rRNA (uracil1498-N3)-methyltransferase [Sporolactobacillus spathodeae]
MQRYFVPDNQFTNSEVQITGDDAHHIRRVMRMSESDPILCVNSHGEGYRCLIQKIEEHKVTAVICSRLEESPELPVQLVLAQGIPKGDKFDTIVQKATECGAYAFLPFHAARSIASWPSDKVAKKLARLHRIAKEAAEQSHRLHLPEIYQPMDLQELIAFGNNFDWKMVAYEETAKQGEQKRLPTLLQQMRAGERLLAVIGPEGGLTADEAASLEANGFVLCGLGPRILRTETASISLLSFVSYHFELLNE